MLAVVRDGELVVTLDHLPAHVDGESASRLADDLVAFVGEVVDGADPADDEGGGRARAFDLLDQSDADAAQLDALLDQFD